MQFRVFLQLYWPQYVRTFCRYHFIEKSIFVSHMAVETAATHLEDMPVVDVAQLTDYEQMKGKQLLMMKRL